MKSLPLFLALVSFSVLVFSSKPYTQFQFDGGDIGATYVINNNMTLTMEITSNKGAMGWIAIGFGTTNSAMMNAPGMEIVRCWTDIKTYTKIECAQYIYLEPVNHRAPHLDCSTPITVLSGYFDFCTGSWQVKFIKPYTSGGNIDAAVKDKDVQINIISAWGKDMETKDVFTYHVGHASVKISLTNTYDCDKVQCPFDCDGWYKEDGVVKQSCVERNKLYLNTSAPFSIYYTIYPSLFPNTVTFQVKGKHSGYVLIGFGKGFTEGTDGLLINYANGNGACTDVRVKGFGLENDSQNDCKVESFTKRPDNDPNFIDITVSRKLRTGDIGDFVLAGETQTDFVVTYGPSDTFDYFRQTAILEKFRLTRLRRCSFGCSDSYKCSGPDENQCTGSCSLEKVDGSCKFVAPTWENAVIVNEDFTLYYNIKNDQISLRVVGRNVRDSWFGINFSKEIKDSNILVVFGKMVYEDVESLEGTREYNCASGLLKSMNDVIDRLDGVASECSSEGNSYYDNGGVNYYFVRKLVSANPKEYQFKNGEKQNWNLIIGGYSTDPKDFPKPEKSIPVPEFTLSNAEIKCSCDECVSGICTKCPKGKQIYENKCVSEQSENWNYFTIPAQTPIEGAYTLWLPWDGSKYIDTTRGFIQFNFTGKKLGWLGFGVGKSMKESDMFAIHKNDGKNWACIDMISKASAFPKFDEWLSFGHNDCELVKIDENATDFSVSIRRPLRAFDNYDLSIAQKDVPRHWPTDFIWAFSDKTQTLSYHDSQKGQLRLNITNASICHPSCQIGCTGPTKNQCNQVDTCNTLKKLSPDNKMSLYYFFCNDKIIFRANGESKGWFGIGFGDGMKNVDMLVISFGSDGKAICTDYWSNTTQQPKSDVSLGGSNDCTVISGSRKDGIIDVWFSRPIKAKDPKFDSEIKDGVKGVFSFAYGSTDEFNQHVSIAEMKDTSLDKVNCTSNGCSKCPQIAECLCTKQNKLLLNSTFSLFYQICQEDVLFRASGLSPGWFGLSFGLGMDNKDMLMLNFTNSVANCYDLWSTGRTAPALDTDLGGTNDCKILNGSRDTSGNIDVWFSRPVKATNEKQDTEFKLGLQNLSFAFGSSDAFNKHQQKGYQVYEIKGESPVCSTNCTTCSGPETNSCLTCNSGFKLNSSNSCVETSGSNPSNWGTRLFSFSVSLIALVLLFICFN